MKNYFLDIAGFSINLSIEESEHELLKKLFCQQIESVWGKAKFLSKKGVEPDLKVKILSTENTAKLIEKKASEETYLLAFKRKSLRYTAFYHTSFYALELLLRETVDNLLKKDGFMLHASSVLSKSGLLHIFLAPRGGGKSTVAKLLAAGNLKRFSDDNLIVRKLRGSWHFFSPPFIEKDLSPMKMNAKRARIYFLKKAPKAGIKKLTSKNQIVRKLLPQVWSKKGTFERARMRNLVSFAAENSFSLLECSLKVEEVRKIIDEN